MHLAEVVYTYDSNLFQIFQKNGAKMLKFLTGTSKLKYNKWKQILLFVPIGSCLWGWEWRLLEDQPAFEPSSGAVLQMVWACNY
jgi:hypothetical protein